MPQTKVPVYVCFSIHTLAFSPAFNTLRRLTCRSLGVDVLQVTSTTSWSILLLVASPFQTEGHNTREIAMPPSPHLSACELPSQPILSPESCSQPAKGWLNVDFSGASIPFPALELAMRPVFCSKAEVHHSSFFRWRLASSDASVSTRL